MPTQAWPLISIFVAMRRQKNPSPQTILEDQILLLRPTPLLRRLILPLMSDFLHISWLASFFFFFYGLGTQDICSLFLNEYSFFISPFSPLLMHFTLFCMN